MPRTSLPVSGVTVDAGNSGGVFAGGRSAIPFFRLSSPIGGDPPPDRPRMPCYRPPFPDANRALGVAHIPETVRESGTLGSGAARRASSGSAEKRGATENSRACRRFGRLTRASAPLCGKDRRPGPAPSHQRPTVRTPGFTPKRRGVPENHRDPARLGRHARLDGQSRGQGLGARISCGAGDPEREEQASGDCGACRASSAALTASRVVSPFAAPAPPLRP